MIDGLAYLIVAAALAVAVWGGLMAALNRPPNRALFGAALAVAALLLVQGVIAIARFGDVEVRATLFVGYLVTALTTLVAGVYLARLEPTRWGSGIVAAAGLVAAPLVLRLIQIWGSGA